MDEVTGYFTEISETNGLTSSAAMYPCGWERHKDNCAGSEVIRMNHINVTLQKAKTEKWIPVFSYIFRNYFYIYTF